jgi:hypothetical protein
LTPTQGRVRWARAAIAIGAVLLVLLLWGGRHWWNAEAADYRNNRLYRPMEAMGTTQLQDGARVLRLQITDARFARAAPLVPDHGKLMHLFAIREPGLDAFAHLHPTKRDRKTFDTRLPELPAGRYRLYGDITYETGFSDTVTTTVEIPEPPLAAGGVSGGTNSSIQDKDNSWHLGSQLNAEKARLECPLGQNYSMKWLAGERVVVNQPMQLRFAVQDLVGKAVELEPYLGMRGHLALRRDDGSVFTHLHPGGSASMAAMQLSTLRTEGKAPLRAAFGADDPLCELPVGTGAEEEWLREKVTNDRSVVSFPYAFPKAGTYRLWTQVKVKGEVLTGTFDVVVNDR